MKKFRLFFVAAALALVFSSFKSEGPFYFFRHYGVFYEYPYEDACEPGDDIVCYKQNPYDPSEWVPLYWDDVLGPEYYLKREP